MPTSTTNYGLIKPGTDDPILIEQLNDNADAIDAALKENADAIENKPDAADIPTPSTAAPAMDGTAAAGTSTDYARADHVHPSDTSKQDALTPAQLAAANSGIDSAKVGQIDTNSTVISQVYNASDCNMSLYLTQDDGGTTGSYQNTHYDTATSKMHFVVGMSKNQYNYWDNEIEKYKYRYISVGLIATNNASKARELTLSIPPVANETYIKKYNYSGADEDDGSDNNKIYIWLKGSVNIGDIWYIRPHLEFIDLETNVNYTMYGAVYKVTVGTPCIIECNTLSCTELTALVAELQARIATLEGNT